MNYHCIQQPSVEIVTKRREMRGEDAEEKPRKYCGWTSSGMAHHSPGHSHAVKKECSCGQAVLLGCSCGHSVRQECSYDLAVQLVCSFALLLVRTDGSHFQSSKTAAEWAQWHFAAAYHSCLGWEAVVRPLVAEWPTVVKQADRVGEVRCLLVAGEPYPRGDAVASLLVVVMALATQLAEQ